MFERFTDRGRKIIILAREEAERHQNDYLGTEHLVLALLRERDGVAFKVVQRMGLSPEQIRLETERNLPTAGSAMTFGEIPFTTHLKRVIEFSIEEAKLLGHNYIGGEHLSLGILREEEGMGGRILRSLGANLLTARQLTINLLKKRTPQQGGSGRKSPAGEKSVAAEIAKRVVEDLAPRLIEGLAPRIIEGLRPRKKTTKRKKTKKK